MAQFFDSTRGGRNEMARSYDRTNYIHAQYPRVFIFMRVCVCVYARTRAMLRHLNGGCFQSE